MRSVTARLLAALSLFMGVAMAQEEGEYEGPSILSRDKSVIGERGGKLLDYRFWGELTGIYDTGLTPVVTDASGRLLQPGGAYGMEIGGGAVGSRTWRHNKLALEYHGTLRHYPNSTYFDGVDQFLDLSYGHVFSRRLRFQNQLTAGSTSLANGYYTYLPLRNTDLYAVPSNELFDNRTDFLQDRVNVTWQKTLRLSVNVSVEAFFVRRRSLSLASLDGYDGHTDVAYRVTRRQTVSVGYDYIHYDYLRQFGFGTVNTAALGYSIGVGRRWDIAFRAGLARLEVEGLTTVNLDPAIAAIVGRSTAVSTFHSFPVFPVYEARIIRRFERSAVTASYSNMFNPGNGVYLTSRETAATIDYSYTGLKRISAGASISYSGLHSVQQGFGNYQGEAGGIGATYKIVNYAHLAFRYDYRHYTTQGVGFKKNSSRFSLGLAFSPGEKPLPIW